MPNSCLPVLELEDKIQIPQSMAIARHLAREFGKFPCLISSIGKNLKHNEKVKNPINSDGMKKKKTV